MVVFVRTIHGTEGWATLIDEKRGNLKFSFINKYGEEKTYFDFELTFLDEEGMITNVEN